MPCFPLPSDDPVTPIVAAGASDGKPVAGPTTAQSIEGSGKQGVNRGLDKESIERRLKCHFGQSPPALAAALSEVRWSFECPAFLAGVLGEMTPDVPTEEAVVRWAIRRGQLWV